MHTDTTRREAPMTTLGAALYLGFVGLGVLWLMLTAEGGEPDRTQAGTGQAPDASKPASTASAADSSMPCAATHASSK